MVFTLCSTYNQSSYIKDAMDGFSMQTTDFPFVCGIIDDASTDGEQEIIKRYLHEHFNLEDDKVYKREDTEDYVVVFAQNRQNKNCYFAVVFLKQNHYQKKKDRLRYISEWKENSKYIAICEGDDYWTDPLKLQRQFDLMEAHPEYSLCFHADYTLLPSGKQYIHKPKVVKDVYTPDDIILGGGGFMATNSMFYLRCLVDNENIPDFWENCPVGDMPLMLYLVSKGNFGYIDEAMSTYRLFAQGSWSIRQNSFNTRWNHFKQIRKMFDGYNVFTDYKYRNSIKKKSIINVVAFWFNEIRHSLHINN